jgi:acetyltransferase-like isoleucine patch superfamily enzyme
MNQEIKAASQDIASEVTLGEDVQIMAQSVTIGKRVSIGNKVRIEGQSILIEEGAQIQDDVTILANDFSLGYHSRIEPSCRLMALGGRAQEIRFGDNCLFAASNSALLPVLLVGDYVKIHNHTLISGHKPCYIGHNSWIGQNNILNSNEVLYIGNNVGAGIYSSFWTHGFYGELLEGFPYKVAPTIIEDDVWIVGAYNVISPGVVIGSRAMIMSSSVVTKSVPAEHTVAGIPARDITDKVPPIQHVSLEEKFEMMRKFVGEFVEIEYPGRHTADVSGYRVTPHGARPFEIQFREEFHDFDYGDTVPLLIYVKSNKGKKDHPCITVFDLATKQYTKRRTDPEIHIIGFMNSYRARFVPSTNPRVGVRPVTGK